MPARTVRRLLPALAAAVAFASPAVAAAEVRTATLTDGVDPGAAFDIAEVKTVTDTVAGTVTIAATFHRAIPATGRWAFFTVDLQDVLGTSCQNTFSGDGDLYVVFGFDISAGTPRVSYSVRPESSKTGPLPDVAPDRRSLTLTITDPALAKADHRCLRAAGGSETSGTAGSYDSTDPVWVDGQAPPPPPPPYTPPPMPPVGPPWTPAPGPVSPLGPATPGAPADPCAKGTLSLTSPTTTVRGGRPVVQIVRDRSRPAVGGTAVTLRALDAKTRQERWRTTVPVDKISGGDGDKSERIRLPGRATKGALIVTLTWDQQNRDGWRGACSVEDEIALTRGDVASFKTTSGSTGYLFSGADCWDVRRQRVEVLVSGGRGTARFTRANPCDRFRGRTRQVGGVRVRVAGDGRIAFQTKRGSAMVVVRVAGRVVMHREVFPREIQLTDPRTIWDGTEDFLALCINAGRQIYPRGTREYCEIEGETGTEVAFRRIR